MTSATPRIGFAGFNLESVTAVPQVTDVADFERVCTRGTTLVETFTGTNTVPGGVLKVCQENGAEFVPFFNTIAGALGPASDAAVHTFTKEIVEGVAGSKLDGIVLYLHGACWAPGFVDVEKHVIDTVRAVAPDLPIAVALDYHGNIDRETFAGADVAVAYRHSPHIDMGQTGERVASILLRLLRERRRPGLAVARPGIVIPSIMSATSLRPLATVIAEARAVEAEQDCDISIMAGFSYADSHNTGMAVICVDWDGQYAAETNARRFASRLHALRHDIAHALPIWHTDAALADLARGHAPERPVVLLEHADRMNDSTHLLRALLGGDYGRVNVPFLLDPASAKLAAEAGAGADVQMSLGGWSAPEAGGPITLNARVLWCGPKTFTVSGRMMHGSPIDLGLTALIEVGQVRISVVSHFAFAVDGDPFKIFGERPEDYDVILLRSKTHFRDFYEPLADRILIVDTPDLGPADVRLIPYRQLACDKAYPWCETPAL
jgi:microcystin degradation protein MlrC